jgi:putative transposase
MPNHVWSYDFVEDRIHDGRKFRMMCLIGEFIHDVTRHLGVRIRNSVLEKDILPDNIIT